MRTTNQQAIRNENARIVTAAINNIARPATRKILAAIDKLTKKNGPKKTRPTVRQIAKAAGLRSPAAAHRHIRRATMQRLITKNRELTPRGQFMACGFERLPHHGERGGIPLGKIARCDILLDQSKKTERETARRKVLLDPDQ